MYKSLCSFSYKDLLFCATRHSLSLGLGIDTYHRVSRIIPDADRVKNKKFAIKEAGGGPAWRT